MRKHGGTPSRRVKHVTLAAISPSGVSQGRLVGGHQSGLAGCRPPPLFKRGASSCLSQRQRQREPWATSPRPSAPTYLPQRYCVIEVVSSRFKVTQHSRTLTRDPHVHSFALVHLLYVFGLKVLEESPAPCTSIGHHLFIKLCKRFSFFWCNINPAPLVSIKEKCFGNSQIVLDHHGQRRPPRSLNSHSRKEKRVASSG